MSTREWQAGANVNLWVALAVVGVGCGGGPSTGEEANLTEGTTVRFEISGAAVGALGGPEDAARASWQAACDSLRCKPRTDQGHLR